MEQKRVHVICENEHIKVAVTKPVSGLCWLMTLDLDGKREHMEQIDAHCGLEQAKRVARERAMDHLRFIAEKAKRELEKAEAGLQSLEEQKSAERKDS